MEIDATSYFELKTAFACPATRAGILFATILPLLANLLLVELVPHFGVNI